MIPFRFTLRFFWPMIPESIPEKRPKTVKESNCDSFGIEIDTALSHIYALYPGPGVRIPFPKALQKFVEMPDSIGVSTAGGVQTFLWRISNEKGATPPASPLPSAASGTMSILPLSIISSAYFLSHFCEDFSFEACDFFDSPVIERESYHVCHHLARDILRRKYGHQNPIC